MNKSKNSYSLLNLMAINIGTMVGVGIFFKNKGILTTTNNIWLALIAWGVGSILCYGLSLGFAEAASVTTRTGQSGTLANWVRIFVGKKAGRYVHQLMSFQYYPIFSVMLVYYSVVFAYMAFQLNNVHWAVTLGLTIGGYALLALANSLSYMFGKTFQMVGTVIKFVPLLAVIGLGFIKPTVAATANTFSGTIAGKAATWNFATIGIALPSVFFAFDGFFGGLALSKEERNKHDATKATLLSVVLVAFFYMVFAAAIGFGTTDGDLFKLFSHTFKETGAKVLLMVISISAMTVANGMMVAGARSVKNTADDKEFLPIQSIKKVTPDGRFASQTALLFIIGAFYALVWVGGAKLLNKPLDKIIDDFGNAITLFGYFAYSLVGLGVFANRYSKKHKTEKTKALGLVLVSSIIVMLLIVINTVKYVLSYAKSPITATLIIVGMVVIWTAAKLADMGEGKL